MVEGLVARAAAMARADLAKQANTDAWRDLQARVAPFALPLSNPYTAEFWWRDHLRLHLERAPAFATELRAFLDELNAKELHAEAVNAETVNAVGAVDADGAPPRPAGHSTTTTRNTVSGGSTHGPVIQAGTISGLTVQLPGIPGAIPDPESWPTAEDLNALTLGARPADRLPGHPALPPYVRRDRDADLNTAVAQARSDGGLVLVLGEPFAGKSRSALKALAGQLNDFRFFAPARGTDLRGLPALLHGRPGRYALWLDDLDEHLGDVGGPEPRLLAQLTALRVVVLATLREDAYDACRAEPRGRILDLAHHIELPREWSPAERSRLAREAARTGDPRLLEAAESSGPEGAPAYLTLSPLLREEWWRARRADRHPRGHALVRAALDLARCGLTGPLPRDLLLTVHEGYTDVTGMDRESVADALTWAATPRHGLLPLLIRVTGDTWRAAPFLVEAAARRTELPAVPGPVWGCALEAARSDPAYDYAQIAARARAAFTRAVEEGDNSALHNLGLLAESLGESADAEHWFRRAAEAGQTPSAARLGRMLAERGEEKDAEPFLETAAEAGDGEAATLLGRLLRDRAARWLTAGRKAGNPQAAHLLGDMLLGTGDDDVVFASFEEAAKAGYAQVAASYANQLLLSGDRWGAEVWYQRAADAGDEQAEWALTHRLSDHRSETAAEAELLDHATDATALDKAHFGVFLEKRGRPDEARAWYLKGYEAGDAYGAFRLAELHKKDGNEPEATTWYRKAAALGHPGARRALGEPPERK